MTTRKFFCEAVLTALMLAGCSKSSSNAPEPLAASQVQPVLRQTFAGASAETRAAAEQYASAVQNNDAAAAFQELQDLRMRPDLTPQQRMTLGRAMVTTSQALQTAAANGDQRSQEALRAYQSAR